MKAIKIQTGDDLLEFLQNMKDPTFKAKKMLNQVLEAEVQKTL